jgi:predicted Zn-dependent protease
MDETILRQTKNFRNIFYRLAMKLVSEGKKDSAIKVLDKSMQVMPKENVAYDVFVVRLCEAYYAAGAPLKANAILKEMTTTCAEKYKYYATFKASNKGGAVQSEMDENAQVMNYCQQVAEFNKQDVFAKELKSQIDNTMAGK